MDKFLAWAQKRAVRHYPLLKSLSKDRRGHYNLITG
nr:MAG TPA: hypothetical protein [Caudoviricetes sp.]DAR91705.1 MAG TPA: hypothetical protein [Caudoviricetes sp.]